MAWGFLEHAYAAATYLIDHPEFGWIGFGGEVTTTGGDVRIVPRDGARSRLFIAPASLWLTLDAGKITGAVFDPKSSRVTVTLEAADRFTPAARLRVVATAPSYAPTRRLSLVRGAHVIRLGKSATAIELLPR